jgi:chemotaxis protein MotB
VKNPSVIIVKKPKRGGHGGHHGGAWKVAYADFVTAMMAFFLVMWLVAQSNAVKAAVAGYFTDPGIFDQQKSNGVIAGGEMRLDADRPTPPDDQVRIDSREALERAAERLRTALGAIPEFKALEHQIEIQLTPEGLRIELVEKNEATFFDSGSATLKPETERILGAISAELGKLTNDVVIEGHTDSLPYSKSRTYTNWELSADRANAARRVMEQLGLQHGQIQAVRGFADRRLRIASAPFDSRNRRVSIVVQHMHMRSDAASGAESATGDPAAGETDRGHAAP